MVFVDRFDFYNWEKKRAELREVTPPLADVLTLDRSLKEHDNIHRRIYLKDTAMSRYKRRKLGQEKQNAAGNS